MLADSLGVVAAFVAAWLGLQLVMIGVVAFGLLRIPVRPTRMRREAAATDQSALAANQQAALDEIKALGFEPMWLGIQEIGAQTYPSALLKHVSGCAFAGITFQPSALVGYPVSFYSVGTDGSY